MFAPTTKILVVDDMMTMRKLVIKACKELGFTSFVEAGDGAQGWTILQTTTDIGLVISDWNMPNSTGLDLLKRVRADGKLKALPFMLLTAESEQAQVKEAIIAGVDNYVIKPFDVAGLKEKMQAAYTKRFGKAA